MGIQIGTFFLSPRNTTLIMYIFHCTGVSYQKELSNGYINFLSSVAITLSVSFKETASHFCLLSCISFREGNLTVPTVTN